MNYEELDKLTRTYMLSEYETEIAGGTPYRSKALSMKGLAVFPQLMREAVLTGNEMSLELGLDRPDLWEPEEQYERNGVTRLRRRNIPQAARRLAITEFSTWYVRGLTKRLLDEGVTHCEVYRGEEPKWEPGECADHEGRVVSVSEIYYNHRIRYWPEPGNSSAFSIPFGPGCHHIIRRVR